MDWEAVETAARAALSVAACLREPQWSSVLVTFDPRPARIETQPPPECPEHLLRCVCRRSERLFRRFYCPRPGCKFSQKTPRAQLPAAPQCPEHAVQTKAGHSDQRMTRYYCPRAGCSFSAKVARWDRPWSRAELPTYYSLCRLAELIFDAEVAIDAVGGFSGRAESSARDLEAWFDLKRFVEDAGEACPSRVIYLDAGNNVRPLPLFQRQFLDAAERSAAHLVGSMNAKAAGALDGGPRGVRSTLSSSTNGHVSINGEAVPPRTPDVDDVDVHIMQALDRGRLRLIQTAILARMKDPPEIRTLGRRLQCLVARGLVDHPPRERKGYALTAEGRTFLAELTAG